MKFNLMLIAGAFLPVLADEDPTTKARTLLQEGVVHKNHDVRRQAALALSLAPHREATLDLLKPLLKDHEPKVRAAAITTVGELKIPGSAELLHESLTDHIPEVAFEAAKALYALKDQMGRDTLQSVLSGQVKVKSNPITAEAREMLSRLKTPKGILWFALTTGVGYAPVPGLGEGMFAMQLLMQEPELSGRASAVLLLARDTDDSTKDAILDVLDDKDWTVRAAGVQALAIRHDASVRHRLPALFDDKHEQVRYRAAAAYLRLDLLANRPVGGRKKAGRS